MDSTTSFTVDFPAIGPTVEMDITECWQRADGSIVWKVEWLAELPKVEIIESVVQVL